MTVVGNKIFAPALFWINGSNYTVVDTHA